MRKVFLFASAAIAALAMVSCNKEIEIQDQIAEGICPEGYYIEELMAEYPSDPATRTAFNETTGKFAWTEGDELAFHLSNGTYTSAPIDPATSKVKLYLPVGVTRDNYAVYPASAVVEEAAEVGNMQVTLPATYDISDNLTTEFVPMPLIATNDAENKNLKFEHVGGLLQVNLNVPAGVKTAKLSMGKTITGTFDLADGSGNGVIEAGEASDDALTFVLSEDGLAEDTVVKLLAPLPSGTYDKFKVAYDNYFEFSKDLSSSPWVFERTQGKKVSISEDNFEDPIDYFWIQSLDGGSISFSTRYHSAVVLNYSFDKVTWNSWSIPYTSSSPTLQLEAGQKVYFWSETKSYGNGGSNQNCCHFNFLTGDKFVIGGDLSTLLKRDGDTMAYSAFTAMFENNKNLIDASQLHLPSDAGQHCYGSLFLGCTNLVAAPELPAKSVPYFGYYRMFENCTSLTKAPDLPAIEVGDAAYRRMFMGCTALTEAPELPATLLTGGSNYDTMFSGCVALTKTPSILPCMDLSDNSGHYSGMFNGCVSITKGPELPATKVGWMSYDGMFAGCTALEEAPALPATQLDFQCYDRMFYGCSSLSLAPSLPATELAKGCYQSMFAGCTSMDLPVGYTLPATNIPESAYREMFSNCITISQLPTFSIESVGNYSCYSMFSGCSSMSGSLAPVLSATTLAKYCYSAMFSGCSSLTFDVPELPATELVEYCYSGMFSGCSGIKGTVVLPAQTLVGHCYTSMFNGCSSLNGADLKFDSYLPPTGYFYYYSCQNMFQGCSSLNSIKVNFSEWFGGVIFDNWVKNVNVSGDFYCPLALPDKTGVSATPSGWTVHKLEEVEAGN